MNMAVDAILFEAASTPMALIGPDLRIRLANSAFCEFFRLPEGQTVGRPLCGAGALWEAPGVEAFVTKAFETGTAASDQEFHGTFCGAGQRILRLSLRGVAPEGRISAMVVSVFDVTVYRQTEMRLRETQRLVALGELVTGLAHESRNVLQRSQACLEMLARRLGDRPELVELVRETQQAQDDLHELYEQALSFGAAVPVDIGPCRTGPVFREAWTQLLPMYQGRGVVLSVDPSLNDLQCYADPAALCQVFRRILRYSLATGGHPPEIQVMYQNRTPANAIRITIRSNGPEVPATAREQIFVAFSSAAAPGHGLDLAIARRLTEAMHGTVTLDSGVTDGKQFTITLPGAAP